MLEADHDLIADFVVESLEHLANSEQQLLEIEASAPDVNAELVNTVFRAVHSTKGAAGFLGLHTINSLAHQLENVLNLIRNREMVPTSSVIDVLLRSIDRLRQLLQQVHQSNGCDVGALVESLRQIADGTAPTAAPTRNAASMRTAPAGVIAAERPSNEIGSSDDPLRPDVTIEPNTAQSGEAILSSSIAELSTTAPRIESTELPLPTLVECSEHPMQGIPKEAETTATASEATPQSESPTAGSIKPAAATAPTDSSIRVSISILDRLMNLAGELVLGRNQLLQVAGTAETGSLETVASRIDQVTSDLQATIMRSRMQPIGNVFNKFTRIVRDLSSQLGKQCDLVIEGKDVELDKTIVEAIGDPLTHLVRNSLDHALEKPAVRTALGKRPSGTITLRASHQAGRVNITIEDDGAGIDGDRIKAKAVAKGIITAEQAAAMSAREAVRLIFLPGFSTAEVVTDVSGRGVGMDVVKTNIARLGGTVDIETEIGRGTTIEVKLPLTLAIIPSLIVRCHGERFAIPQSSISELVRVRAGEIAKRVERVKDAEVLRLRGHLLPLLRLSQVLGAPCATAAATTQSGGVQLGGLNVIVVETGRLRYGLVVDALHDSEEIVVKPLGRHLKNCTCLAGATILGDGRVALITDIAGIATHAKLSKPNEKEADTSAKTEVDKAVETQSVLLFTNNPNEQFAVPMALVKRIERVSAEQIDSIGGRLLLQYRNSSLPLLSLEDHIEAKPRPEQKRLYVIVFALGSMELGLIIPRIIDIREVSTDIDTKSFRQAAVLGSLVIDQKTTRIVDLIGLATLAHPEWNQSERASGVASGRKPRVLLAEDSSFFRKQVTAFLESNGYEVVGAEDGQIAWNILQDDPAFDLMVTDVEMPNMNGFELCRKIKDEETLQHLPVIALTSLAGQEDIERGTLAGIDEYQVKMDRERLLAGVARLLAGSRRRDRNATPEAACV